MSRIARATGPAGPDGPADYDALLGEIRSLLQAARTRAYQAVDNIKVQAYWQVGERLVRAELEHKERADYGARLIKRLARDLGLTRSTLFRIVRFYRGYPIVTALSQQISWSHYELLAAIEDTDERVFYEAQVVRSAWGVRQLDEQIKAGLYRRALQEPRPAVSLPGVAPAVRPEEAFCSLYSFTVPGLPASFDEAQLERALLAQLALPRGAGAGVLRAAQPAADPDRRAVSRRGPGTLPSRDPDHRAI